jgi:hypothetical protein
MSRFKIVRSRRKVLWIGAFFFLLSVISWNFQHLSLLSLRALLHTDITVLSPITRKHIAVASRFPLHQDVYLPLVQVLQNSLTPDGRVQVYASLPPWGFSTIMNRFHLYNGSVKEETELIHDITVNPGEGGIDMVILGTCEIDLRGDGTWVNDLLVAWDAREPTHKFQLVCIVHNVVDAGWQGVISDFARRSAIRFITLSDQYDYLTSLYLF